MHRQLKIENHMDKYYNRPNLISNLREPVFVLRKQRRRKVKKTVI